MNFEAANIHIQMMAYDNECNLVVLINVNSTNHYAQAPRSFCDWKHQHFAKTFANREK